MGCYQKGHGVGIGRLFYGKSSLVGYLMSNLVCDL